MSGRSGTVPTTAKVLSMLKRTPECPVSGAALAAACGVSRVAIHKAVRRLCDEGYEIHATPRRGYRLLRVSPLLLPSELEPLPAMLAARIIHRPSVHSTMDAARIIAEGGDPIVPTLVVAERQTAGRGRLGRRWLSAPGGVYATFLFVPELHPSRIPLVGIAFAVALAAAFRKLYRLDARVKWPNDVLVRGRKVAGVLTEMRAEPDRVRWLAVGVGINANQERLHVPGAVVRAATLAELTGAPVDRAALVRVFAAAAAARLEDLRADRTDAVLDAWRGMSDTLGRRVRVPLPAGAPVIGRAEDIAPSGALCVRDDRGVVHEVHSGDCVHLRHSDESPPRVR